MSDDLFGDVFAMPSASRLSATPAVEPDPLAAPAEEAPAEPAAEETSEGARLVDSVRDLRARLKLVDAIVARAQKRIEAAERQGAHAALGVESMPTLVERTLGEGSTLQPFLACVRAESKGRTAARRARGRRAAGARGAPASSSSASANASAGDGTFARACAFVRALRELEQELRARLREVAEVLARIEREELYREASYDSYEDFLDRAVGPSPALGPTLLMLAEEPAPPPAEDVSRVSVPVDPYAFDFASLAAPAPADAAPAPAHSASVRPSASGRPSRASTPQEASPARPPRKPAPQWVAIAVSAIVAAAVGSLAGLLSSPRVAPAAAVAPDEHAADEHATDEHQGAEAAEPGTEPAEHGAEAHPAPEHGNEAEGAPAAPAHAESGVGPARPAPAAIPAGIAQLDGEPPAKAPASPASVGSAAHGSAPGPRKSPLPGFRVAEK
jgi:hypothetical protein